VQYREFRIQVENDHDVTIVRPSGVPRSCKIPMDTLRRQTIGIFQDWLAAGKITTREEVIVLGTHLYEGLFDPSARRELEDALAKAEAEEDTALRIVLSFAPDAPELAQMPWEYLYFPDTETGGNGYFIAAMRDWLTLSREVPLVLEEAQSESPPLKVLLVVSKPDDLVAVKAEEVIGLVQELADEHPEMITIDRLDNPTKRSLAQKVAAFEPHVLHFFGHGKWDRDRERGTLGILREDGGGTLWVTDADLADLIKPPPRLIFLHACEGARTESYRAFRGVALLLVRNRVPAVIAMQFEIENKLARAFAITFYQSLAARNPIDVAVRDGRREIGMFSDDDEENFSRRGFGSPVVYLQQGHGIVIAEAADESPSRSEPTQLRRQPCPYPRCDAMVLSTNKFCPTCRRPISTCPNPACGSLYPVEEGFCADCGYDARAGRPGAPAPVTELASVRGTGMSGG
jgi:hypothetical protein